MENFFKKIERVGKGILVGAALLGPNAQAQQVPKDAVPIEASSITENKEDNEAILKSIQHIEAKIKANGKVEISVPVPTYAVILEKELGITQVATDQQFDKDNMDLQFQVTNFFLKDLKAFVLERNPTLTGQIDGEIAYQKGNGALDEDFGYVATDTYVVLSHKIENQTLTLVAKIVSVNTKNVESVSVSKRLQNPDDISVISNPEAVRQLEKLIREKIALNSIK